MKTTNAGGRYETPVCASTEICFEGGPLCQSVPYSMNDIGNESFTNTSTSNYTFTWE